MGAYQQLIGCELKVSRPTLLAVSACEWEGLQGRPQHFMRLATCSGWRVVYLEPPASLAAPLRDPAMLGRWRRWCAGSRPAGDGIELLAPPPVLPFGGARRAVNRLNQAAIAHTVRRALARLGVARVDLYAFLPTAIDLVPRLPVDRLIYDRVDDHAAFGGLADAGEVEQMEDELMAAADLCLASARRLTASHRPEGRPPHTVHLIPNGCEPERFEPAGRPGALPTPPELAGLLCPGRAVAGFFGGLGSWIDVPLLAELARLRPRVDLVLIGPRHTDLGALDRLPNVHLLGPRPYEELPAYLQHFAVCLIPFRRDRLTASVNPIKLYEYLAAGKPVVSTPIEEVAAFAGVVDLAADAAGFAAAIDRAAAAGADSERAAERRAIARGASWSGRWQRTEELIRAIEPRRPPGGRRQP